MEVMGPVKESVSEPVSWGVGGFNFTKPTPVDPSFLIDGTDYLVDGVDNKLGDPII